MKPKKVTPEGEREALQKSQCDQLVARAAQVMVEQVGASVPMILDRMMTYCAAQACCIDGSPKTAAAFHILAARIEAGAFHSITGEDGADANRH